MSKGMLKLLNLRPGDIFRFENGKKDYVFSKLNLFKNRQPVIRYKSVSNESLLYETVQVDALVSLIGETTLEPFSIKKELAKPYTAQEIAQASAILDKFRRPDGTLDREAVYLFNLKSFGGEA